MNDKAPPATDHDEEYNEEDNLSFMFGSYESKQGKYKHTRRKTCFLTEPFVNFLRIDFNKQA